MLTRAARRAQAWRGRARQIGTRAAVDHCNERARKFDGEALLCSAFMPARARAMMTIIRAFNVELATVREIVHGNPQTGRIRLQWWREAIDGIFSGTPPDHPVAVALAPVVREGELSRVWFDRMIDARERDFEADMLPLHEGKGQTSSLPALETYADDTYGSLLQLALECSDSGSDVASEAASFIGRAQGMSILLRAIPPLLHRGTLRLPPDVCAKHNVNLERLGGHYDKLAPVVFDIACLANAYVEDARSWAHQMDNKEKRALMVTEPTARFLAELERHQFDIFQPAVHQSRRASLLPRLLWNRIRGVF